MSARAGYLRLHSLPAPHFWMARNSLTQRVVGPQSTATTEVDVAGMKEHDVAGLALLNRPYAWIGVRRTAGGFALQQYDQTVDSTISVALAGSRVRLRAESDLLTEVTHFSYSTNGATWTRFGRPFITAFQLKTFQGARFSLFHYNEGGVEGGVADFDIMRVDEPNARGLMQPIPRSLSISLRAAGRDTPVVIEGARAFTVMDRGLGRVALRAGTKYVSIAPVTDSTSTIALRATAPGDGETFQWMETMYGDLALMSLATHRYLRVEMDGTVTSDSKGPEPDPNDGTALRWSLAKPR